LIGGGGRIKKAFTLPTTAFSCKSSQAWSGDDGANTREASSAFPASLRRMTSYLDIREVYFFNVHVLVIRSLLLPMTTASAFSLREMAIV
jgi:hypothetical protein